MLSTMRNASSWVTRWASEGVQACTALLDEPEVEARRIGDRLQVVRRSKVAIVSRNGWKLSCG